MSILMTVILLKSTKSDSCNHLKLGKV